MSNYNFSVTLDGLNNINANDIDTDNIVTDYLTVNKNSSVPLVTPYTTNSNQIASCAFVQNALTTNLANYALLNPATPQTFTGSQNFPTQATTNNTTLVATTAYVKNNLLNYALLGSANTFTANNTFNAITNFNDTLNINSTSTRFSSGANVTSINQNGIAFSIKNLTNNNSIRLNTSNSSGVGQDNVFALNGNTGGLQGDNGNTIDITGTQATIGGTSVPKITTQPLTTSNTNEIASTAFVKTNLLDYVTLSTNQTITGNKTFNGTTTLNNLFVSNYVDLTLTTYENQFYGDIYGYRGVVCQNGFYVKSSPGAGATTYALIDSTGNISTTSTIAATGNISTSSNISANSITLPTNSINDSYLSSNVVLKNGTQTFTGVNTFNNLTVHNATLKNFQSTQAVFPGDFRMLDSTQSFLTQMYQVGTTCIIDAPFTSSRIGLSTRNAANVGLNNLLIELGNHIVLQGSSNEIDILGNAITLNGVCTFSNVTTPVITTTIPTADNSTKIATTAFVKNQGYALSTALNNYALLTPTANPQIFNGQQKFRSSGSDLPISIGSTTAGIVGGGGLYVATAAGQYNPIVKTNDCVILGVGGAIDSANTKLTLTTYASASVGIQMDIGNMTFDGGIIRQNSPFNCGYSYLGTPVTIKGFYDIGYNWTIPYAAFTGGAWTGTSAIYNILTLAWDGTGNKRLGVWQVDIVIMSNCTGAPLFSLSWNAVNATTMPITSYCVVVNNAGAFSSGGVQIARLSFVLNVVNLTTTYYLNSYLTAGAGLSANTTSNITFTRIA